MFHQLKTVNLQNKKKAEKYKLDGYDIEIIDEDTFYNLLNMN